MTDNVVGANAESEPFRGKMVLSEEDLDEAAAYLVRLLMAVTEEWEPGAVRASRGDPVKGWGVGSGFRCALCGRALGRSERIMQVGVSRVWVHEVCWSGG